MNRCKIVFFLERDESGFPPVDAESLWVELLDDRRARVDNIPFFVRDATLGDIVEYRGEGSELQYVSTLHRSENSLVRVVCYPQADPAQLRRSIEGFGCETEFDSNHRLIAVSIPEHGDLEGLRSFLQLAEDRGEIGYEEPILTR
jgi:hypothetical protein